MCVCACVCFLLGFDIRNYIHVLIYHTKIHKCVYLNIQGRQGKLLLWNWEAWTSKARITRDNKEYEGREEADLWGRG